MRERGAIALAERILELLAHGDKAATYKYALLLALLDWALENHPRLGENRDLTTRELALRIIALYWRQTDYYEKGQLSLRQYRDTSTRDAFVLS